MKFDEIIAKALEVLKGGGVILYPTDSVWGLGCDATNEKAVKRIFEIKRRSEAKSLVLLAADMDMICRYVKQIPSIAIDLVEVNDSPMTIVYPGAQGIAPSAVAEDGSVGIRIPLVPQREDADSISPRQGDMGAWPGGRTFRKNQKLPEGKGLTPSAADGGRMQKPVLCGAEFCRQIARKLRRPLVSTSANISGEATPACFGDISEEIASAVDFVVPVNFGDGAGHSLSFDSFASGKPSQIIKLGLRGEVEIIRR